MAGNGHTNHKGFSLLEAFVALSILLVGLAGVAASFQAHVSKMVSARNQAQAAVIAQSVLTELTDSHPDQWNLAALADMYQFNYEGEMVDSEPYYQTSITRTSESGWQNVTIGVTWKGWKIEQAKSGSANSNEDFAYVLEASVAPFVGDNQIYD